MAATFLLVVLPIVRNAKAGSRMAANSVAILLQGALLAVLATAWVSVVLDQAPCFMGIPNCD